MMWQALDKKLGDYKVLSLAHRLLDDDHGLSEGGYFALQEFVYDEIGPTMEMQELFDSVLATDGRWYVK